MIKLRLRYDIQWYGSYIRVDMGFMFLKKCYAIFFMQNF